MTKRKFLHSVEFLKDHRVFKTGDVLEFRPGVNLLVGDQGSGKSTLLQILSQWQKYEPVVKITSDRVHTLSFDFEKDSFRRPGKFEEANTTPHLIAALHAGRVSHGESSLWMLEKLDKKPGVVYFIDEPDQALSPRSCYKLVEIFRRAENKGCQIISSVHNPIIIEGFCEVLNLETKSWCGAERFLESQKIF